MTACSQGAGQTEAPAKADPSKQNDWINTEAAEIVVYNVSNASANLEWYNATDFGKEIKAKFPNVKINFIATGKGMTPQDLVVSGQQIDLIISSIFSFPLLAETNLLYDMSELIKKNNYDINRLEPYAVEYQKQFGSGGIYGFPISNAPVALFYNKDIFDKFGVAYPKDGMTWDEAYELARKLTRMDNGTSYYGFSTRYPFMYNVNQLSLSYYDPKAQKVLVSDDKFRLFMENFTRFASIPGNEKATTDMFSKEKNVAMMAYQFGKWDFDSWDMVSLPYFKEAPGIGPQVYPTYMNISSTSKHKELAFEILKALTTDDYQMRISKTGTLPSVRNPEIIKAFGEAGDPANGKNYKGKNVGAFFPAKRADASFVTKYDDIVAKRMNTAFTDIAAGKKDSITALREVQEASTAEIQSVKK